METFKKVYWDIETTGLAAKDTDMTLAVFYQDKDRITMVETLEDFYQYIIDSSIDLLIGFNTGSYRGGFDLPYLRTKFIQSSNLHWPFLGKNIKHLDVMPLVQAHLNTKYSELSIPSENSLYKDDLVELAFENDIQYTNKKETYAKLLKMHSNGGCNWMGRDKEVIREENSLQWVYQILFDPDKKEVYLDGEDMIQYAKENKNDLILEHCVNDCRRLKQVAEIVLPMIPDYYMEREITKL